MLAACVAAYGHCRRWQALLEDKAGSGKGPSNSLVSDRTTDTIVGKACDGPRWSWVRAYLENPDYVWFGSAVMAAVDSDGKVTWRKKRTGPFKLNPGICSSPISYEGTVILLCDEGGDYGWLQASGGS